VLGQIDLRNKGNKMNEIIYHITEKSFFKTQIESGEYFSPTYLEEGFIHLSTKNQVENTLKRYYSGKKGLVILQIDTLKIGNNLKYELASNGEMFPHIYGPIPTEAILIVEEITN
jgi:uncharacterized protein (DUF952 family)